MQARRPLYVVVTAILLVLGVEALRRATVREFPDAAETEPREMLRPLGRLRPGSTRDKAAGTGRSTSSSGSRLSTRRAS